MHFFYAFDQVLQSLFLFFRCASPILDESQDFSIFVREIFADFCCCRCHHALFILMRNLCNKMFLGCQKLGLVTDPTFHLTKIGVGTSKNRCLIVGRDPANIKLQSAFSVRLEKDLSKSIPNICALQPGLCMFEVWNAVRHTVLQKRAKQFGQNECNSCNACSNCPLVCSNRLVSSLATRVFPCVNVNEHATVSVRVHT